VPDSTWVRFVRGVGEPSISGLALEWQNGHPRVITERGDTVIVPEGSTLAVRLKEKQTHANAGAVIGWALGVALAYAACPPPRSFCGEEDPTPLVAAGLGAFVGSKVRTDWWVDVRWDPP
jgi:hypothetical protein